MAAVGAMSTARRERLKENIKVNDVLNSVKIEKYYGLAARSLAAAEERYARVLGRGETRKEDGWERALARYQELDECYVFWRRFARLAIEVIPSHNYYRSPSTSRERKRLESQQASALGALEKIVATMDRDEAAIDEERARRQAALEKLEAERREAERKERARREAILAAEAERQRRDESEARRRREEARKQQELEEALCEEEEPPETLAKGQLVTYARSDGTSADAVVAKVHFDDVPPYYTVRVGDREVQTVRDKLRPRASPPVQLAPPPAVTPAADEPVESPIAVVRPDVDARILGAKPLDDAPGSLDGDLLLPSAPPPPPKAPPESKQNIPAKVLKERVAAEWRRVGGRVESMPTYQGRVKDARGLDSTNGCAVIAPLTCYQHITARHAPGATNDDIVRLIDSVVPPILSHVRAKHGLGNGAFIIPSDVHDYLYDQGAIRREMFEGVYGGDVINDAHVFNLVHALDNVPHDKRAAAAFFFKEHVTAILRVHTNSGYQFHFVDSMPGSRGGATRTVCPDANALHVYLKYYALSKFGARELALIDSTPWSDFNAEFDPRVFQAFVWQFNPDSDALPSSSSSSS